MTMMMKSRCVCCCEFLNSLLSSNFPRFPPLLITRQDIRHTQNKTRHNFIHTSIHLYTHPQIPSRSSRFFLRTAAALFSQPSQPTATNLFFVSKKSTSLQKKTYMKTMVEDNNNNTQTSASASPDDDALSSSTIPTSTTRIGIIRIPDEGETQPFSLSSFLIPPQYQDSMGSVMIPHGLIRDRIHKLAYDINCDYADKTLVRVCAREGGRGGEIHFHLLCIHARRLFLTQITHTYTHTHTAPSMRPQGWEQFLLGAAECPH